MSVEAPICLKCKFFNYDKPGMTCLAFPDGIPGDVIESIVVHDHPIEGDHGVQFEAKEEDGG